MKRLLYLITGILVSGHSSISHADFFEDFSNGLGNWYLVVYNHAGGSENDAKPVIDTLLDGVCNP